MPTVKPAELARHWGVGPSYVSNLRARAMPEFESLEAADLWRLEHCPPRARRNTPRDIATSPERAAGGGGNPLRDNHNPPQGRAPLEPIDTSQFLVAPGVDFDALMVQQAENTAQIAHGLYIKACERQDVVAIAGSLRNWNEASRQAADIRERFMGLQQKSKLLAPIDKIMDVVGTQMQEVRLLLNGMGTRIGTDANPADPALAQRTIDAEIDRVYAQMATAAEEIQDKAAAA